LARFDERALRDVLAAFVTPEWPIEKLLVLYLEWRAGTPTAEIGNLCGTSKHAVVGKAHRLIESGVLRGLLAGRASPIVRQAVDNDGERSPRPKPLPPGARTIPLLPSERAALEAS
jgi:hypothetical protein